MNKCETCKKKPFHPDKKCCFNCTKSNSKCEVWHECGKDCPEWDNAIKTNADRIRAMSDEELAVWITSIRLDIINEMCKTFDVEIEMPIPTVENTADVCEWLKQPAEE